jgi:DNA modification methylase
MPRGGGLSNILRVGKNRENDYRAAFPVALPTILVHNFTREGDLVCDPFMGSGTTAVACHRTKRHFVGCELDPAVHKNALARISAEMAQQTLF